LRKESSFIFSDNPFWEKSNKAEKKERGKKEEEREKNKEFSGHYVCHTPRLQRRTGSARTSLGPKSNGGY
jgi:hypothetical protein